jgi:tetratricopeptide (TPR) repeat protein
LNHLDQAGEYLRKAESAYRQWMAAEPVSSVPKRQLAVVLGAVGHLTSERGQFDEANRAYTSELQLAREALRGDPKSAAALSDVMLALMNVGEVQTSQSNYVAAMATMAEGTSIGEQLTARDAANGEWQMFLTTGLNDQGRALRGARHLQEALAYFRRAWTLCEKHVDAVRQSPHWTSAWRDALEEGEQLERELATQAAAAGLQEEAATHKSEADKLHKNLQSLPPDN